MSKGRVRRFAAEIVRVFVLKPDGIGDFVLAMGALRLLAREYGEENLIICVKSLIVPLAQAQFPRATVVDLPVAARRKVINLFAWNAAVCLPTWLRLRGMPADVSVCLRSMRNYLETFFFLTARARRKVGCENILLHGKKKVRHQVEAIANRLARTEIVPYPPQAEEAPREIEAHRRVMEQVLGRPVPLAEVIPSLRGTAPGGSPYWIVAPITNLASKVYPAERWRDVLVDLMASYPGRRVLLAGSEDQRASLEALQGLLEEAGCSETELSFPRTLVDYTDLIAGAELMLTVDTAAAHFATALDRPAVVVFSGLHSGMFGPWQRSARQIWLQPEFAPGAKKKKWHAGITPSRVAESARGLLSASARI